MSKNNILKQPLTYDQQLIRLTKYAVDEINAMLSNVEKLNSAE